MLNLTDLEVLDISHNQLSAFSTDKNVVFPNKTTNIFANNNQISCIHIEAFSNLTALKKIDLRNNLFKSFEYEILNRVKFGLDLQISGNCFYLVHLHVFKLD